MPVLELRCPDCGHGFRSLVMEGARVPPVWVCSQCGSREAHPVEPAEHAAEGVTAGAAHNHPWAVGGGGGACRCCG